MTGAKNILYGWMATLMLGCCALFVVSCSSDDPEQEQKPEQGDLLQLVSCTRSDDASIASGTRIRMWITTTDGDTEEAIFERNASLSTPYWTTGGRIKQDVSYYLYGVMSKDNITTSVSSADYSSGATLTVSNLSPLALEGQDPCVIVGVKGTTTNVTLGASDVKRGQFIYEGQPKDQNYVHLLLERLYSAITFRIGSLDAEYGSLRTIKLTKLQLKVNLTSDSKLSMTVPLTANNDDSSPVDPITTSSQAGTEQDVCVVTLFEDAAGKKLHVGVGEIQADEIQPGDIQVGCFDPSLVSSLSVVSYYDVYDKGATPYKLSSRTAENALGGISKLTGLNRGEKLTLTLTVNPSYLYQLSDPDATTITISE